VRSWNRGRAVRRKLAAVAVTATAMVVMLPAGPGAASASAPGPAPLLLVGQTKPVPVHTVATHPVQLPPAQLWQQPKTAWPAAGSAIAHPATGKPTAVLRAGSTAAAAPSAGSARAGSLPVWVGQVPGNEVSLSPGVRVTMASQQAAAAAGVRGAIFSLSAAGPSPAGRVYVSLDYSSFAFGYGGDYASRLRLVGYLPAS
jgi:hypothetical protein